MKLILLICIIIIISLIVFLLCKIEEKYEKHKKKKIHIFYINKIKNLDRHIFNNLNNKSSNSTLIIRSCERWIRHWLDKANILDEDLRLEVKNCCVWNNNACARDLEDLGWTIL